MGSREGRQKAASCVGVQSGQIRRFGGCQAQFSSRPPSARRRRRRRQRDGLYCTSIVKVAMGMVGICYIHGKICYGHVMGMLWACYGHVMGMLWACYGHVMGMLWAWLNSIIGMLVTWLRHAVHVPGTMLDSGVKHVDCPLITGDTSHLWRQSCGSREDRGRRGRLITCCGTGSPA